MISIVIPAYNEEQRIGETIKKIAEYFKDKKHEIIVVSDGSRDKTKQTVEKLKIPHTRVIEYQPNRGKGYAVRTGMLEAKGDYILFSDADLSTPIEQFNKFSPYFHEVDVVIGSRALPKSIITKHQPFYRELIGKVFNKIVRFFTVRGVYDTQCGFKMFSKKAAKDIFSRATIDGFSFDVEALMLAKKLKYEIMEIPIVWINDERSTVKPVKDALRMLRDVIKIRWRLIRGYYDQQQ